MAEKRCVTMEKLVALCKNRGYIFPGSEIYGGLANTWDFGPLGVEFKNNVKKAWWKKFVQFSYRREIAFAADGANDFFVRDKRFQSVVVHTFDFYIKLVFFAVIFRKVVGAVARFTAFAVH